MTLVAALLSFAFIIEESCYWFGFEISFTFEITKSISGQNASLQSFMNAVFFVSFERREPFLASNSMRLKSNDGAVVSHFICVGLFRYSVIPLFRIPCFEDSLIINNDLESNLPS